MAWVIVEWTLLQNLIFPEHKPHRTIYRVGDPKGSGEIFECDPKRTMINRVTGE